MPEDITPPPPDDSLPSGSSEPYDEEPLSGMPEGSGEEERTEFHDAEDAPKSEIFVYSLGGIIDELTTSGFRNLNTLLVIAFQVSPILVGFLAALKSIWDGIADPIVANWSDNCKSRFGRRRPFILAGGVVMSLIAWATWEFIPENDNLLPNEPNVPRVQAAEDYWKQFAQLHLAMGVKDYNLQIQVAESEGKDGELDAGMMMLLAEDLIKQLGKESRMIVSLKEPPSAEDEAQNPAAEAEEMGPEIPLYTMEIRSVSASTDLTTKPEDPIAPPFSAMLEVRLEGPGMEEPLVSLVGVETEAEKLTSREREKIMAEHVVEFFAGAPDEAGVRVKSAHTETAVDVLENRNAERAVLVALQWGMIEVLSERLGLPYDMILPEGGRVDEAILARITDRIAQRVEEDETFLSYLKVSNNLKINPSDGLSEEEEAMAADFLAGLELSEGILPDMGKPMDLGTEGSESISPQVRQTQDLAIALLLIDQLRSGAEEVEDANRLGEAASYQALIRDPQKKREIKSIWQKIGDGFSSFIDAPPQQQKFLWYVGIAMVIMAIGSTLYGAAYYAQGIEIAPSYNGRTLVVAYRSVSNSVISIVTQLFLPIALMPIFVDSVQGSLFLVYVLAPIGLMLAFLVFFKTKERTVLVRDNEKKPSFFRSIKEIGKIWDFWRILLMYLFMGYALGSFVGLGGYLSIYYVFEGNLIKGASYGAITGTIGTLMALLTIPLVVWLCNKLGKHNALRIALGSLGLASAAKYFCYNPEMPELMFIPALLYSPAIGGFYKILSTMMGDVTDLDELRNGERREGMFGAVMAIIMKTLGAFTAIAAGTVVVASGFEIEKGVYQDPGVFNRMLVMASIVPGVVALLGYGLLFNFNLTSQRVAEIKQELAIQRKLRALRNKQLEAQGEA